MLGIILIALVAFAAGLAMAAIWSRRRSRPADAPVPLPLDPADIAELASRFDEVEAEHVARQGALLEVRLRPLVVRRVPVRCIETLPARRTTRVRFADGTAVTFKGETAGDAGVLASVVMKHRVLPGTCRTDATGTHLVFDWSDGRRHLSVLVTGLDQPD